MRAAVTPRRAWILLAAVVLASEGHSSLVAAAKPHTSAAEAKVDRARLDAFVERAMRLEVAPGLAVVVVKGKERSYARGFGYADREARRRVGPETLFYIASTTKSFTALAAALMQHRGAVDLDAPLSRSLKGARLHPSLSADSITLRDLLTHTHRHLSGWPGCLSHGIHGGLYGSPAPGTARRAPSGEHGACLRLRQPRIRRGRAGPPGRRRKELERDRPAGGPPAGGDESHVRLALESTGRSRGGPL